jgi:hypothetical protein
MFNHRRRHTAGPGKPAVGRADVINEPSAALSVPGDAYHPALRYGSRRTLLVDHDVYAFVRALLDDRVLVAFNRGKTEAKVELAVLPELVDGDYIESLSGAKVPVRDGKISLSIPGQTAALVSRTRLILKLFRKRLHLRCCLK